MIIKSLFCFCVLFATLNLSGQDGGKLQKSPCPNLTRQDSIDITDLALLACIHYRGIICVEEDEIIEETKIRQGRENVEDKLFLIDTNLVDGYLPKNVSKRERQLAVIKERDWNGTSICYKVSGIHSYDGCSSFFITISLDFFRYSCRTTLAFKKIEGEWFYKYDRCRW